MKRSVFLILICFFAILIVLLLWVLRPSSLVKQSSFVTAVASPSAPALKSSSSGGLKRPGSVTAPIAEVGRKESVAKIMAVLATPITFYGRVVDQNGNPVVDADVDYGTIDKFDANGSNYTGKSDANGNFFKSGIAGAVLTVGVRKEGYYNIHGASDAAFAYGIGPDATRKEPPTADNPAIFILQKMGATEPLMHVSNRQYKVSKTGEPTEVDVLTGKQVPLGQGSIRFERRANDGKKDEHGRFDWNVRITIPGGGLVERESQFAFEAPVTGYNPVSEIKMPVSLGEQWRYTVNKDYFIKTREGKFARINLEVYAGHDNSIVMESFVNPNPESRNLEFDPTKIVKSRSTR